MCEGVNKAASVAAIQLDIRQRENNPPDLILGAIEASARLQQVLPNRRKFWAVINGNTRTAIIYLTW